MRLLFVFLAALFVVSGCNSSGEHTYAKAANPLDAGREFIDGCLKGQFNKAAYYMIPDEPNTKELEKLEKSYESKSGADKKQYKQASIVIEGVETVNDSVTIINYRNSFDRIARKLKVIQRQEEWKVDFKYTFSGNM